MLRRSSSLLAGAVLGLVAVGPVLAQEAGPNRAADAPVYSVITVYDVSPGDASAFEDVVMKVKEAATAGNLSSEFSWAVYEVGSEFHFVGWRTSMASFDDPNRFINAFQGTGGEAIMQEALGMFSQLVVPSHTTVQVAVPEWSYWPDGPGQMPEDFAGAMVFNAWVKFGSNQAYNENTLTLFELLEGMEFPYPVFGNRTVVGDGDLTSFIVLHDGLANFYGENNLGNYLQAAGLGEDWGEMIEARDGMLRKAMSFPAGFRADLSYLPDM